MRIRVLRKARLMLVNAVFHELSKCKEIVMFVIFDSSGLKVFPINVGRTNETRC